MEIINKSGEVDIVASCSRFLHSCTMVEGKVRAYQGRRVYVRNTTLSKYIWGTIGDIKW